MALRDRLMWAREAARITGQAGVLALSGGLVVRVLALARDADDAQDVLAFRVELERAWVDPGEHEWETVRREWLWGTFGSGGAEEQGSEESGNVRRRWFVARKVVHEVPDSAMEGEKE